MATGDWFLSASERGNPSTAIDRDRRGDVAWSTGNRVRVLVDGATYFERLYAELADPATSEVWFTDWEGHTDEQLVGPGTEIGAILADLIRRAVRIRGLLWRSHPRAARFAEEDNLRLASKLNRDGAVVALDERIRRGGSHHQKLVIIRRGPTGQDAPGRDADVAFVGGIDLCHGRRDDYRHLGDPQAVELDERYGEHPPWHDIQLEIKGPAIRDVAWSFRERWNDPTPLDHRNPLRAAVRRLARQPSHLAPLTVDPTENLEHKPQGTHSVQVLRTYPHKHQPYDFAVQGERSIARAYLKAIGRARALIAIEDQYLWSADAAAALARALVAHRELLVVIVVPRFPDRDGKITGAASRTAQGKVIRTLRQAGGERVAFYDLVNGSATPIYVHAKSCIIDDVWLEIGSDNLNRRSWTHDSELSCAIVDETLDPRGPRDPAGLGDGARQLARDTRIALWREHLGREPSDDDDLIEPRQGFETLRRSALALDAWCSSPRTTPRPPGHLRTHHCERVSNWLRPLAQLAYRTTLDPDGRPRAQRRAGSY
ncbi:MAG: phosphatidylserine/phosphatidylglycerophosphate/cardiolipinsynthase-like protein [Acidimicrobiales bacterium]|nr:phosphatidylserine/phosphatidylglycerophosphate/cardiolipinsynthase-like protein [Acidimicrobiales bacterium]